MSGVGGPVAYLELEIGTEVRDKTIDRSQVVLPEDWKIVYPYIQHGDP